MKLDYTRKLLWEKIIHIVPEPKQSHSFSPKGGYAFVPTKKKRYQEAVNLAVSHCDNLPAIPFEGPLALTCVFCFPLTKSDQSTVKKRAFLDSVGWLFNFSARNDLDNLMKPVSDALNKLVVYDDGHFSEAHLIKVKSHQPFIKIKVSRLEYKTVQGELKL